MANSVESNMKESFFLIKSFESKSIQKRENEHLKEKITKMIERLLTRIQLNQNRHFFRVLNQSKNERLKNMSMGFNNILKLRLANSFEKIRKHTKS